MRLTLLSSTFRTFFCLGLLVSIFVPKSMHAETLQEAFESALPANGFDRNVILESGNTYTGGLLIGRIYSPITDSYIMEEQGLDVRIEGNGAILDLNGEQICISYCDNRLEIEDCIVINGNVRFRGGIDMDLPIHPVGLVRNVTFYQAHDYGVRIQGAGTGISIERNIFADTINTGPDFSPLSGLPNLLMPTGSAVAANLESGGFGLPTISENWTFFQNPSVNNIPLNHFAFL
jgi:hypothetical protein